MGTKTRSRATSTDSCAHTLAAPARRALSCSQVWKAGSAASRGVGSHTQRSSPVRASKGAHDAALQCPGPVVANGGSDNDETADNNRRRCDPVLSPVYLYSPRSTPWERST